MEARLNGFLRKNSLDVHAFRRKPGGMRDLPAPLTVGSVQFGQAFGKQLSEDVGASGVVGLRLGLAAAVLLVLYRPAVPRSWAERRVVLGFGTAIARR
ncbi:inner membrane transporter RhtA [Amycolatopsis rubida]|uniref:Inner membrane transporter RhtA n=2 Tax=Amycolatopsis rubida TaxID=112413 RepID=A0A1I5NRP9_9PSEU|nr:inner membrane transporter RhtA [Amycolatopsis rubida]